jgi:hypothetical protein
MNWRAKSLTIATVERMPFSARIYYLLQRFVTRSIPRSAASIESVIRHEQRHLESFRAFTGKTMPAKIFEFGAGWDLCSAIVRHAMGAPRQNMVDLHPLATAWQVNHVIAYLGSREHGGGGEPEFIADVADDLWARKGIKYLAPFDARSTGYPDRCVDLVASTNTMEHIPVREIEAILIECRRILHSSGIMSMKIDYSDHYSHADSSIGPYNFLRFPEEEWRAHNHANHYQNRLRHVDYARLFREAGFEILHQEAARPEGGAALPPLAEQFKSYSEEDLLSTEGYFVLGPAS